jgi:hypothetical protein
VVLMLGLGLASSSISRIRQTAQPGATQAGVPQVIVAMKMATEDLVVMDIKFRGVYNKIENKYIPLTNYDFAGNASDELLTSLAADRRATWRRAKPEEMEKLEACFGPKYWKQDPLPQVQVDGDRLLLIGVAYSSTLHVTAQRLFLSIGVRMADRQSGKVLWKQGFNKRMGLPGKLEDLQAENQKGLKEALNKLMEEIIPEIKEHIARSKI